MVSSVSASGASGDSAAVQGVQPSAAAPAATKPAASGEDTVKISATAQEVQQPTSAQVRLLHAEGQSVAQIASKLEITPHAVQTYLVTLTQTPTKSK
jgi:DNA-binding NarL/FixJ family response regulator